MPDTIATGLIASEIHELKNLGGRLTALGVNFAVCDFEGRPLLLCKTGEFETDPVRLAKIARDCLKHPDKKDKPQDDSSAASRYISSVLIPLTDEKKQTGVAVVIDLGNTPDINNRQQSHLLAELLRFFVGKFTARRQSVEQMDMISSELAQTYEELVLLYKISTNMEIVEPDANFLQMACDSLTEIVGVEGIAILQEKTVDDKSRFVLVAGAGVIDIDDRMTLLLHSRLQEEMSKGKEVLLDSDFDGSFKYEWPRNIHNVIVVPLTSKVKTHPSQDKGNKARIIGMLVAINRLDKPDFDSPDAKLFTSVASECAVFVENNRLFSDLKELFIGSLKALTRSIDAKDRYTRGHSERVGFISKWIAEHLAEDEGLDHEQIQKIYLAGLLHDIGKIGIDEKLLCKVGRLTAKEKNRLRMHPSIGANILSGIRQMRDIIPGVLNHHERVDGKGYPAGLKGDQIPLMGKIVGLADCFDAMTSERVYQDTVSVDRAIAEIENRLGTQFDEKVAAAFLESDILHLWDLMQEGAVKTYGTDDFTQYGSAAIGTLIT
ncbi:MAG: HD domain-containing phosphohydrolase [Sedimentisphaerales bacterium]|jgi:HD-GYP domain-containing protein (c-di-GMP phosphodiesterase class II)